MGRVNLQQAATKVFGWSQRNLMLFLGCGLGLLLLAIVSFWTWPADVDAALIVAAITVQCGQTFYRYRSLKWHAAGDEIRRLNLSQEALGSTVPQAKLQKVLRTVGRCDEPVDPKYWRSKAAKGPTRLVEMTLEAAYYTETTAAACKMLFGIIAVTGVIVVVIVMVIMLRLGADRPSSELSIRILTTLLAYFVATDCWILAYEYGHLEEAACAAQDCCFALRDKTAISTEDAFSVALGYNASVSRCPPLLSWIHKRHRLETEARFEMLLPETEPRGRR